jgi:hypothetical protein
MWMQKLAVALLVLSPLGASAYDTGKLSCENIAQLAGQALSAKQAGIPLTTYLSALNERIPQNAQLERNLVAAVTNIVYENELLAAMQPSDAYAVFRQDCIRSQAEDGAPGTQQDKGNSPGDDAAGELKS